MKKMPCIAWELLHWFVDEVVSLQSRADSALLMDKAREFRDRCRALGADPDSLPVISKQWLARWRAQFGISYRQITCRFKVSETAARDASESCWATSFVCGRCDDWSMGIAA